MKRQEGRELTIEQSFALVCPPQTSGHELCSDMHQVFAVDVETVTLQHCSGDWNWPCVPTFWAREKPARAEIARITLESIVA